MAFICLLLILAQLITVSLSEGCGVADDISLTELRPSDCDLHSGIKVSSSSESFYQYFAVDTQQTEAFDGITLYFELGPVAPNGDTSSCSWDAELILSGPQNNALRTAQTVITDLQISSSSPFNFTFDVVIPSTFSDSQYLHFYFKVTIASGLSTSCSPSLVFCYDESNMKTWKIESSAETCLDAFQHPAGDTFSNVDFAFALMTTTLPETTLPMNTTIVIDDTSVITSDNTVESGSMIMPQSVIEFDESFGLWIAIAILSSFGVIFLVSGIIVARCTKADNIMFASVLIFIVYSIDVFSDIFFCISIWTDHALVTGIAHQQTLFILAVCTVVFIVLPMVKNFYDLIQFQRDTQDDPLLGDRYTAWLNAFNLTFLLLALISGSTFGTMKLMNSNLLGIRLFSMGLSTAQLRHYHSYRMMNVVLLENVPQVVIQIAFISMLTETVPPISVLAAVTSILSIIVALVDYVSKKELIKQAVSSELFTFQITSNEINAKPSKYRNRQKKVIKGISKILVLDPTAIEIVAIDEYSDQMGDGLIIHFLITTLKYTVDKIHQNLRESLINGSMARNMSKAWALHVRDPPSISHLQLLKMESVDDEATEGAGTTNTTNGDNLVPLFMNSVNSSSNSKLRKKIVVKASDSLRQIPLDSKDNDTPSGKDVEVVISPIVEDEADLPATINGENDKQQS